MQSIAMPCSFDLFEQTFSIEMRADHDHDNDDDAAGYTFLGIFGPASSSTI